jgi:hypothetical protein
MIANKLFARLSAVLVGSLLLAGCTPLKGGKIGVPPAAQNTSGGSDPALLAYYAEERTEGKIFVLGDGNSHVAYLRNQDLPSTVMKVGAGPAGEAVILQSDSKDAAFEERLWNEFQKRNLYYAEEKEGDALYVVGSLMSHYNFLREKKLAQSEAVEVNGQKVHFETDPANEHLVKRLKARHAERHAPAAAP